MKYCECEGEYVDDYKCNSSTPLCQAGQRAIARIGIYQDSEPSTSETQLRSAEEIDDALYTAVMKALRDYRLSYVTNEDGDNMHLVDRMTPDEDDDVEMGIQEIKLLAEDIVDAVASQFKKGDQTDAVYSPLDLLEFARFCSTVIVNDRYFKDKYKEWIRTRKS